jgi:hypothetical protein
MRNLFFPSDESRGRVILANSANTCVDLKVAALSLGIVLFRNGQGPPKRNCRGEGN